MRRRNGLPFDDKIRLRSQIGFDKSLVVYCEPPAGPRLTSEEHHSREIYCRSCEWVGVLGDVACPYGEPQCPHCRNKAWLEFGPVPEVSM